MVDPKLLTFEDYDMMPSPEQIELIYSSGFQGVVETPQDAYMAFRTNVPRFYDAYPQARGLGAGRLSLPFRCVLALEPEFGRYEAQTTGDCVSHATRNGGMVDYCCDAYFGETTYKGRFATENIYGWRGHGGQGASCVKLATYVSPEGPGGYLPRQKYTGSGGQSVDLSTYNSRIGHNWGRGGTPDWLNEIAATNKALRVYSCKSIEEARDAVAFGFGISRCSYMGFSNTRNEDGLARRSGRWSHAESWIGCDDTEWAHDKYGGALFCEQNSWGLWNRGPKRHDQPDGSYWLYPSDSKQMIRDGGVFVIASVRGFERELSYSMEIVEKIQEISRD